MTLRILFFSVLRDVTGEEEIEETLPETGCRVSDLLERLYGKYPGLKEWDGKILVAAEQSYVDRNTELSEGQEIAIMPPVQGG